MSPTMFEAVFNTLPFPCCIVEAQRIVACNPAMLALTGHSLESATGSTISALLAGGLPASWWEGAEQSNLTYKERVYKIVWSDLDKNQRMLILQDQHDAVEREQRKNDMLNTASHDLKSGLSALTGFLELIANLGPLSERQQHYLGRVKLGIQELIDLTDRLLDIGWIESGMALELQPVNLTDLAKHTAERYSEWAKQQGVKLQIRTEQVPYVAADMRRIRQVIANLIGNAIKYSPGGGNVEVLISQNGDGGVELSVQDEGLGIEREHLERIFDRFYRVKTSDTQKIEGTGMGLFISNSILEQHGQRLQVESEPGIGSRFWFILPAMKTPQMGD